MHTQQTFLPASCLRLTVMAAFGLLLAVGPFGLLQIVAWTGMAFDYSARYGLAEGLGRTFDGEHPCQMCTKISDARQKQAKDQPAIALPPVKPVYLAASAACLPPCLLQESPQLYFGARDVFTARAEPPRLRPPRTPAA